MAQSTATTVAQYLAELPAERRRELSRVRDVILKRLPKGYVESMNFGMIAYEVPLATYPSTYNGQPLMYAALAAQKNHLSLYLMCVYSDPDPKARLTEAFQAAGKRLDMGKSCIRFQTADDLPLPAIGKLIAAIKPAAFIKLYESARAARGRC